MNHQERKLAKRAAKQQPSYMMTADQITKLKQDAFNAAYDKAWEDYLRRVENVKKEATNIACNATAVIPLIVAHDKLGFGGIRLRRFLDYMMTWLNAIDQDPHTLVELQELAEEYCGIKFKIGEETST